MSNLINQFLRGLIMAYRYLLAPLIPGRCRYLPSCSHYGLEALQLHGPVHGSWLTLRRLLRCHPWGGHGFDPVPIPQGGPHGGPQARPVPLINDIPPTQLTPPSRQRSSYEIDKATPHV